MAGATIRCQVRGGGAQHPAVTDDSLTSRAVPSGHEEYAAWFTALIKDDLASATQVAQAVAALRVVAPREEGPAVGLPLVDRITGSSLHHLAELRPGSAARSEIRVLVLRWQMVLTVHAWQFCCLHCPGRWSG